MSPNNSLFWYNGNFILNFCLIIFLATDKAAYLHFQQASHCSGNTYSKMSRARPFSDREKDQDLTGVSQLTAVQSVYNMDVCNTCKARTLYGNQDYEIITQGNHYYDMTAKTVQNTEITILIKASTENW